VVECARKAVNDFANSAPQREIVDRLAKEESSARLQNTAYLRVKSSAVWNVMNAAKDNDVVEDPVGKRQYGRIGLDKEKTIAGEIPTGDFKQTGRYIDSNATAQLVVQQTGGFAASAA
jgi:hypothetical protein